MPLTLDVRDVSSSRTQNASDHGNMGARDWFNGYRR